MSQFFVIMLFILVKRVIFIGVIPFILNLINENEYFSTAAICTGTSIAGTLIFFIIYMTYVKEEIFA